MAELENNKPKTEKTSASVTSNWLRLCPTTKLDLKDTSCNISKLKSRSLGSKPYLNENKKRPGHIENPKANLQKSKLTEFNKLNKEGYTDNEPLFPPRNYRGQIPVYNKHSLNIIKMSSPTTRASSPVKRGFPKEKSLNKIKTITLDSDLKRKNRIESPAATPPQPKSVSSYRKSKSRTTLSPGMENFKTSDKTTTIRRADMTKQSSSLRVISPGKRKTKVLSSTNVQFNSKKGSSQDSPIPIGDSNSFILKQASQPSLSVTEKFQQSKEKISLNHLKNEIYSGDHRRLSVEKVRLCIEKSEEDLNLSETKRSFIVSYASDDMTKQEEISLTFLQNLSTTSTTTYSKDEDKKSLLDSISQSKAAIRTLSGQELILTPSMKLDIEKEDLENDIEISELLHETEDHFENQKEVIIPQDDANEYDSEVSTEREEAARHDRHPSAQLSSNESDHHWHSAHSLWRRREEDLLNDVDYRQSVYHPTVSRRQNGECSELDFKSKTKSIEDFDFDNRAKDRLQNGSHNLKNKYTSRPYPVDTDKSERSWTSGFEKDREQIYNPVIQEVPFYGMKRIRTKKERVSGALLHFTLKVIRLLAIFNLWPGDNCYMLTSQSLRFAR